jgi:predicted nucleotidyltransferase
VFTTEQRQSVRDELVTAAREDERISGAALTGSAALGRDDRWSDIDLALSVAVDLDQVVADLTARMYAEHRAVGHLDLWQSGILNRVHLLANTLRVDVAFWPEAEFGATGPSFALLFGTANDLPDTPPTTADELIGWAWHYAVQVRSSLARGRLWQTEYTIGGMRAQVHALTCLRHGVPAVQGRGLDDLPAEVAERFAATRIHSLDPAELVRAFNVITELLVAEIDDEKLANAVRELAADLPA